jgi:ribonuclease Z
VATEVVLTGTGIPLASADRAGPGTLVRTGNLSLQFDAGRATLMRLCQAGVRPPALSRLFVTHHHTDHLTGADDLVHTRWMEFGDALPVVAPSGPSTRFLSRMLDVWDDDIAVRQEHTGRTDRPGIALTPFEAGAEPRTVWTHDVVRVSSVLVRHPPVVPAVGYRVDTPDGAVVISGDTVVCEEVERLAVGAAVLVHEVARVRHLESVLPPDAPWRRLLDYHSDAHELGAMASRAGVPTLVLTHLVPPPNSPEDVEAIVRDVRDGGFSGTIVAGPDLTSVRM